MEIHRIAYVCQNWSLLEWLGNEMVDGFEHAPNMKKIMHQIGVARNSVIKFCDGNCDRQYMFIPSYPDWKREREREQFEIQWNPLKCQVILSDI